MKKFIFNLILLLVGFSAFAQKDAPVAGHAANLVDLLKRNYNAGDPETRKAEIAKDRDLVISIFKNYLYLEDRNPINSKFEKVDKAIIEKIKTNIENVNKLGGDFKINEKAYDTKKKQLGLLVSQNLEPKLVAVSAQIGKLNIDIVDLKKTLEDAKEGFDLAELTLLAQIYSARNNEFLSSVMQLFIDKYTLLKNNDSDGFASINYTSALQKGIPFIGGNLGFETYVDGLGRFLAQRIKDELTTYVIEEVKKWLQNPREDDPLAEFKVLLPRTTNFLIGFTADKLTSFPNEIKQFIEDDFNHILPNAANLKYTPRFRRMLLVHPNLEFAFEALQMIPQLSSVKHPIDYFKVLETSPTLLKWKTDKTAIDKYNIANTIFLSGMIAQSMIIIENDEPRFAGSDFLGTYVAEPNFCKLYIGFLSQQNYNYYNASFSSTTIVKDVNTIYSVDNKLKSIVSNPTLSTIDKDLITNMLKSIGANGEKVYVTALEIKQAKKLGKKIGADTVYNFIKSVIDLSTDVVKTTDQTMAQLFIDDKAIPKNIMEKTKPYFIMANNANEIVFDFQRKKYATALTKSLQIASTLLPDSKASKVQPLINSLSNFYTDDKIKNWNEIFNYIANFNTENIQADIVVPSKVRTYASSVSSELSKLKQFHLANYQLSTTSGSGTAIYTKRDTNIDDLQKLMITFEGATVKKETVDKIKALKELVDDEAFQRLVIAYYSNIVLEVAVDEFLIELEGVKVNNTPIFLLDQRNALREGIYNYAQSTFNNYIKSGYKTEKETLLKSKEILYTRIKDVLLSVSQNLNYTIDPKVMALVNFVNDMASADDAVAVQKAIESFALPTGSYSIKRKAQFNLSVNSYPGVVAGMELSWKSNATSKAFAMGLTAPVGLSFTWGQDNQSSLGFFIPVIDIGAVTRFRLDNDNETKTLPELSFKNIFSPGLYGHYGFKKSPLSLYLGAQYGPELKEVTKNATTGADESKFYESMRIGFGIVLDIPLFNIHTKSRL